MRFERMWCVAAGCAVGLGGCLATPADLGHDQDAEGTQSNTTSTVSGEAANTGGTAGAGDSSSGGSATADTTGGGSGNPGGGASCKNAATCGGDVVGSWTVTSSCLNVTGEVDLTTLGMACESVPVTGHLEVTGTWTANADGTYSDQTLTSGTEQIVVPSSCLSITGTPITCAQMAQALGYLGYVSTTCTTARDGTCTCEADIQQSGGMGVIADVPAVHGDHSVADDMLTLTGEREDTTYAFCATSTELSVLPLSTTRGTLTGAIEFDQQ